MTPSPALQAFLDMLAFSEGTATSPVTQDKGYDVIVTGEAGPNTFSDYSDHPFAPQFKRDPVVVRPGLVSTAAGRYQLLYRWWAIYKKQLVLNDFGHASQDAVALQQIKERGAIEFILDGDIASAIAACSNIWASLPGSPYGQPTHPMQTLLAQYKDSYGQEPTEVTA